MKRIAILMITAAVIFVLAVAYAAAATQTLTGTLTDTMCGKKHMMPSKTDAECTRECSKANSDYALVVGDKVYTLKGDTRRFDPLAGKQAKVTGEMNGTSVQVASITEVK
jgi:hypothetical protein